jgi:hypothetical protein
LGSSSRYLRIERGPAPQIDETGDDGVDASSLSPLSPPFQPHLFHPFVSPPQTSLPRQPCTENSFVPFFFSLSSFPSLLFPLFFSLSSTAECLPSVACLSGLQISGSRGCWLTRPRGPECNPNTSFLARPWQSLATPNLAIRWDLIGEEDARCFVLTPCVQDPAPLLEVPASCRFQETEAGEDENRHSVVVKERHISDKKKRNGRS